MLGHPIFVRAVSGFGRVPPVRCSRRYSEVSGGTEPHSHERNRRWPATAETALKDLRNLTIA